MIFLPMRDSTFRGCLILLNFWYFICILNFSIHTYKPYNKGKDVNVYDRHVSSSGTVLNSDPMGTMPYFISIMYWRLVNVWGFMYKKYRDSIKSNTVLDGLNFNFIIYIYIYIYIYVRVCVAQIFILLNLYVLISSDFYRHPLLLKGVSYDFFANI